MKQQKWYLQTWFISFLFIFTFFALATPFFLIFPLIGIVLILLQKKEQNELQRKYGTIDELDHKIKRLSTKYDNDKQDFAKELQTFCETQDKEKLRIIRDIEILKQEKKSLSDELLIDHYSLSSYDGLSSEECKNKLTVLKNEEQDLIKKSSYTIVASGRSKLEINNNIKQMIRCFNSECDNILMNISTKNIDSMRSKITKCFDSLNKIFAVDGIQLTTRVLELKLEELNLVYTYELKKEQEREQQRAIKEQMIEEEKVRREIEKQKAKLEKDQQQCSNEITKLMTYLQKTQSDVEKQLYVDKIKELEDKLKALEEDKKTVLEREANALAGYVYVISNIGSFGENIYKIGMTRRLEPMDRVKELSSASVPFEFDVHAMIFSDNAPALETTLHKYFEKESVNRVNPRKEFFRVSLDEIEKVVKENYNNTVEFTRIPVAAEYRQTLSILESEC